MRIVLSLLLAIFVCSIHHAQTPTSPPGGTIITAAPAQNDSIATSFGQYYIHTNPSWPAFQNNCYVFAINDILQNAINGNNPSPAGGSCNSSAMSNLTYSPGDSDLPNGLIVYTGVTSFRYLNNASQMVTNNSVPVRAFVDFSVPVSYYSNSTFVSPVTGDFDLHVRYECYSPSDAMYSSIFPSTWVPAKKLFDDLTTDPNSSLCVYFQQGYYTSHQVTALTTASSSTCVGSTVQLIGGGTGNNLSYTWTGPNSYAASGSNATISNTSTSNTGTYNLTATDDVGCKSNATANLIVHEQPVATAGGTQTICVNSTATISGATALNGTINWTHNGSGSISNTSTTTPTYNPAPSDAGNTVVLTMTVTSNNSCAPSTAQATYNIIIQGNPKAVDGGTSSICSSSNFTVSTATAEGGTVLWTHNGSGTLTNPTTLTPTYTPGSLDDGNMVVLTMTVTSNNMCAPGSAFAFHMLNVVPMPYAVAGGTVSICENSTYLVTGAVASYGAISWTHNGAGTLVDDQLVSPTYTASAADIGNFVTLTMTVTSSACAPASATADFTIIVQGLPYANITNSSTVCAGTSAFVTGSTVSNGTFSWSHNGSGSLVNNGTLNPTYNSSLQDGGNAVEISLNVASNNSCSPATYSGIYYVTVDNPPLATLPSNMNICGGTPFLVDNVSFDHGTPSWTTTGSGTLTDQNTGTPTYTPTPADYGQIVILTLNVTSNNTCAPNILSSSFNAFVQNPPVAVAGGITKTCESSLANITGSSAIYGTIEWTHDGAGTLTNQTTLGPVYNPSPADVGNPVTLTLTVTSNNSCAPMTATDTYSVIIEPLPVVSNGTLEHICVNSPHTILNFNANNGNIEWTHDGLGILSDPTTVTPTYTPSSTEEGDTVLFTITVTSNNSCAPEEVTGTHSLVIDPTPTLIVSISTDTMCAGTDYIVGNAAATNGDVLWTHTGSGTLTGETSMTPSYSSGPTDPNTTITLTCVVTSTNGCAPQTLTNTVSLYVEPVTSTPNIAVSSLQNIPCYGDSTGAINIAVSGGGLPYTYNWSNNQNTPNLTNVPAGVYILNLIDNHGCAISDTFLLTQPDSIALTSQITPIDCAVLTDGMIVVSASGGVSPYEYTWISNNTKSDTLAGVDAGEHEIQVLDANGCLHTETIVLGTQGTLNMIATPETSNVNIGTDVQLNVTGASSYTWSPEQFLSCTDCANPISNPTTSTVYIVDGTLPNGCTGRDTVELSVYIDCSTLTVPNIFSPNNIGPEANNTFGAIGATACVESYLLLVFNRWGEQVFESQDVTEKWDGTYKGKPQSTGIYFYRIDMSLITGETIQKSGNVTLVR